MNDTMLANSALEADLRAALGPAGVLSGDEAAPHLVDFFRRHQGSALAVARPASTEEVAETIRICRRHQVAIVPQGGNTGLCGGAIPIAAAPSVVLSLRRMNRLLALDPECNTVTAEAGCILQTIHDAAEAAGRSFAMDWGARGSATIGGGISTNAGGLNVLRYGTTREQVLGLEVVLADGRVWDGLRALRKDSSGYDLKQLFIGAEGTLGVVTRAVLKLHPRPPHTQTMCVALPGLDRLMPLFTLARAALASTLSAFELIPGSMLTLALERHTSLQRPLDKWGDWVVLIRASGEAAISDRLAELFEQADAAGLLADASLAQSLAQEANLWRLRDEIPPGNLLGGRMVKWDASVPINHIVPFLEALEATTAQVLPGGRAYAFGHVGDGNLHLSLYPPQTQSQDGFAAESHIIEQAIDRLIWQYGGSICAEHGVGILNVDRVVGQKPAIEQELMRRLRDSLDPEGLFNPGKLIARG